MERASRVDRFWASIIDWWIFLSPLALVIPVRDGGSIVSFSSPSAPRRSLLP